MKGQGCPDHGLEQVKGFRYDGKARSSSEEHQGIGAATVAVLDRPRCGRGRGGHRPRSRATTSLPCRVDLTDRARYRAAVDDCGGPIDALFSCAGVADGPKLPIVNFIGTAAPDRTGRGRRSNAAWIRHRDGVLGWRSRVVGQPGSAPGVRVDSDVRSGRRMDCGAPRSCGVRTASKQAVCVYTGEPRVPVRQEGASAINAVMPGPTDTPLRVPTPICGSPTLRTTGRTSGLARQRPEEQASILAFLCSDAARRVVGGEPHVRRRSRHLPGLRGPFPPLAWGVALSRARSVTPRFRPPERTGLFAGLSPPLGARINFSPD